MGLLVTLLDIFSQYSMKGKMMLRSSQLAERLGLSKVTVIQLANDGKIPALKLPSGHYRFNEEEVRAALSTKGDSDDA